MGIGTGILGAINRAIALMVFIIMWKVLPIIVMPHLYGKLFLPALFGPLGPIMYSILDSIFAGVFVGLSVAFVIAWAVYVIIQRIAQGFIGMILGMIGWPFTPFWQLRDAGIFSFFDGVIGWPMYVFMGDAFSSTIPPPTPPMAILDLTMKGSVYLAESLGLSPNTISDINRVADKAREEQNKKDVPLQGYPSQGPSVSQQYDSSYNTDDVVERGLDKYQQCLEENMVTVSDDMSTVDSVKVQVANQMAQATCKLQQIQLALTSVATRMDSK